MSACICKASANVLITANFACIVYLWPLVYYNFIFFI
jgi:hypothetical protein